MLSKIRLLLISLLLISSVFFLNKRNKNIPPIGKFLDPYHGFLALVNSDKLPEDDLYFSELKNSVRIAWDKRRIPHIFANNEYDLFFTQGYIHALERLWQMEFQVFFAAGRLSEILGEKALEIDLFHRRIGMQYGAEIALKEYIKNPITKNIFKAYSDGINAYINSLSESQYPIEYKILDYKPENWSIYKTALLYMYMSWTLSGFTNDLAHTKFLEKYGINNYNKLYNFQSEFLDPIIPRGTLWDLDSIKIVQPDSLYISKNKSKDLLYRANPNNGSNNFTIGGTKTYSGKPILANDPHLDLTFPSIWFENHLKCPTLNSYGVSLLGAPCIVIGFNKNIAWGATNGMNDVMDFYDITFKDSSLNEYSFNGKWKKINRRIEKIKILNAKDFIDTVLYTHHGPIINSDIYSKIPRFGSGMPSGRALKWLAHSPSLEGEAFYLFNKSKNISDFKDALKKFSCPGQNFIFASKEGDIALWQSSDIVLKWENQGRFILDGSNPKHDWNDLLPFNYKPYVINPKNDFISSANQYTFDNNYPYYYPSDPAPPFRGARINQLLSKIVDGSYTNLQEIQNDNKSLIAELTLPILLNIINEDLNLISKKQNYFRALEILESWNYFYDKSSKAATIFEKWIGLIELRTWQDNFGLEDFDTDWPSIMALCELIVYNPNSEWFDEKNTDSKEILSDIVKKTFYETILFLKNTLGDIDENWNWGNSRRTDISHIAKIPGFGKMGLNTSGNWNIPNATAKTHGPSWRYVVELGDTINAYGVYPGGQSGYPGSKYYDNFLDAWLNGELYKLEFPAGPLFIDGHKTNFLPK